jgi:RHS repeat-associated protein
VKASYAYTLGPAGNRTKAVELGGRSVDYGYDDLYRLKSETIAGDARGQNGQVTYTLDNVGNRLQRTSTVPAVVAAGLLNYDANDRTATDPYDANGNLLANGTGSNVYDFENRLVQSGGVTIVYDGDGNRVQETVAGATTRYLTAEINPTGYVQVVAELNGSNQLARGYLWGLQPAAMRTFVPGTFTATNAYFGFDGHGSVRYLTDDLGHTTDTYDFDAFGNLLSSTGTTQNNYLFAGEQFDPALGIYYNRARYYDQRQGRFWTMDTYEGDPESPASLHLYAYVGESPIDRIDPSGNRWLNWLRRARLGTEVHNRLYADFQSKVAGGLANRSIKTILGLTLSQAFSANAGLYLRPDLADRTPRNYGGLVGLVYEIKRDSNAQRALGETQLFLYMDLLQAYDPQHRFWAPGDVTDYDPIRTFTASTGETIEVDPPEFGLIVYRVVGSDDDDGNPKINPQLIQTIIVAALTTTLLLSALIGMQARTPALI